MEGGLYTGVDDRRIAVTNDSISCESAIAVIRSFRSLLPKHHHGASGASGWWTLPSLPGWRCSEGLDGGGCARDSANATFSVSVIAGPSRCGNQVTLGVTGVLILSWRDVGCHLRRTLARHATTSSHGFRCETLDLNAGGGGALCRQGGRFVELGFE